MTASFRPFMNSFASRLAILLACTTSLGVLSLSSPASAQTAPTPTTQAAAPSNADLSSMSISTTGFGGLRLGMTLEEAQKALGQEFRRVATTGDASCFYTASADERLVLRVKGGKLTAIDTSAARIGVTRSGIRVGESADKVKSIYGKEPSYKESASPYDQRPVVTVGSGANQVAVAMTDGKVDLIRLALASDLWGRCE